MFVKTLVLDFDRSRVSLPRVITSPFYPLKKAKIVLGAINNNFHFFAFIKSFSVFGPLVMGSLCLLICVDVVYVS